jgi:hypothetical protein
MPKPSPHADPAPEYDDYAQAAYWHTAPGLCQPRLHDCEHLLRAAQAEVERLHQAAEANGHGPRYRIQFDQVHVHLGSYLPIPLFEDIFEQLSAISQRIDSIMANLDQLTQDVADIETVGQSVITLLDGLKAALDAAGTDPVKLAELSSRLGSEKQALSDAVTRNTPAEEPAA